MGILRFILSISVVIAHSSSIFGFDFVDGQTAVQAFYIISGFYMTLILNEKYVGINNSYKLFITNRFLRLYPIYWIVLILTIAYSVTDPLNSNKNEYAALGYYANYISTINLSSLLFLLFTNFFLFLQDTIMFLGLDTTTGSLFFTQNFRESNPMLCNFLFVPQAWTIGIEIAFYLIAPFIVRRKLKFIVLLIIISVSLRVFLYLHGLKHDPWSYRFFPTELTFFLLGTVSYHIYLYIKDIKMHSVYLKIIYLFILGISCFYSFSHILGKHYLYLGFFFICLPFVFILTKSWKNDRYIGELSYPIYISHLFVLACMKSLKIPAIGGTGVGLTIITILFSILLNELVAKKIENIRQNRVLPYR